MHPQRMDLATLSGVHFAYDQQVIHGDVSLFDLLEIGVLSLVSTPGVSQPGVVLLHSARVLGLSPTSPSIHFSVQGC